MNLIVPTEYNYGTIQRSGFVKGHVTITNPTDKDIPITGSSTCGCTVVTPNGVVPAKGTFNFEFTYNTNKGHGAFTKNVLIYEGPVSDRNLHTLKLTGITR